MTFLQYATSGPQSVKLITGLPAYASTASAWLDAQVSGGYWADSDKFKDVVDTAATNIWPGWGATLSFSSEPAWTDDRRSGSGYRPDHRLAGRRLAERVREPRPSQRLHGQVEKTTPISTGLTSLAAAPSQGRQRGHSDARRRRLGAQSFIGYVFSSGYVLLLLAFGLRAHGLRAVPLVHRAGVVRRTRQLRPGLQRLPIHAGRAARRGLRGRSGW